MNITKMKDQEKSVMLARLCGWKAVYHDGKIKHITDPIYSSIVETDYAYWSFYFGHGEYLKDPGFPNAVFDKAWYDEFKNEDDAMNHVCPNLYEPINMALAWRVTNWAETRPEIKEYWIGHAGYWWFYDNLFQKPPEDAQRLWLDKILELAIEAGMVTE